MKGENDLNPPNPTLQPFHFYFVVVLLISCFAFQVTSNDCPKTISKDGIVL